MTPSPPAPSIVRLARDLTDRDVGDPFADEMTRWLSTSPRFRSFATTYRSKIHKKIHDASGAEGLRDVRSELLAAFRLLIDRRFLVTYEAYGAGRTGPDLTVTYRTTTTFNVEVTRLQKPPEPVAVASTLLVKLRQLPPSVSNVVLVASERPASDIDVAGSVRALRSRADARDDASFRRAGLESSRGFYDRFLRLSAVISWCDDAAGDERAVLWTNPSARIPLQARAAQACLACFRAQPA